MNSSHPAPVLSAASELSPRLHFIDNLRWTLVILVISMHAADTYSPLGNWYFVDRTPLSTPVLLFFAARQMFLQAFFMGLLFTAGILAARQQWLSKLPFKPGSSGSCW